MTGRISLLIDSPLRTVMLAARELDSETRKQINAHVKVAATPIWEESTRAQVTNRLQARLADSARVGVTQQNVFLRVGATGVGAKPTRGGILAKSIEFGGHPDTKIKTRSRSGKPYERRMGGAFRLPRRRGYVAHPAAAQSIPRIAALVVQTTVRTAHEMFERW